MAKQKVSASSTASSTLMVKVKCASFGCKRMMQVSKSSIIKGMSFASCGKCAQTCDVCIERTGLVTRKGVTLCKSCIERNIGLIREARKLVGAGR